MSVDHYENFPVASLLCPPALRPAIAAIYWFARVADDLADEGEASAAQRRQDLAAYREELHRVAAGAAPGPRWARVFAALGPAILAWNLPLRLLDDLLDAFVQDTHQPHYPDRAELLDYCPAVCNPVGRLLLHLYGVDDTDALRRSDGGLHRAAADQLLARPADRHPARTALPAAGRLHAPWRRGRLGAGRPGQHRPARAAGRTGRLGT